LGLRRRAAEMSEEIEPYERLPVASSTSLAPPAVTSVPWISCRPCSRAAKCARTQPAKEHSSVSASAR